eukprot:gb/GECG01004746.1/.p1 GENE.gb/GECG01004746.1/~~gb/GECG01004746.1/.p1  ORF type:complete len:273 (+),score=63.79 gb/GECG01004746.1/:1-819(+)
MNGTDSTSASRGGAGGGFGRRRRGNQGLSTQNTEGDVSAANVTSLDHSQASSGGGGGGYGRRRKQQSSPDQPATTTSSWMTEGEEKKDDSTAPGSSVEAFGPSNQGNAFQFAESTTEVKPMGKQPSFRKNNRAFDEEEDVDVIQEIPDLDEEKQQDLTTQVAHAPRNVSKKVQSLEELEEEPQARLRSGVAHGTGGRTEVDLSLLSSTLAPSDAVQEEDEYWDLDHLLQQMAQELQSEHERKLKDGVLTHTGGDGSKTAATLGATSASNSKK